MIQSLKELQQLRLYPIPTGRPKAHMNVMRISGTAILGIDRRGKLFASIVTDRKGERFRHLRHWARGELLGALIKLGIVSPEVEAEANRAADENDRLCRLSRWREGADVLKDFNLDPSKSMTDFLADVDRTLFEWRNR